MNKRYLLIATGLTTIGAFAALGLKALAQGIPSPNPLYYAGTLTEGGQLVNGTRAITINLWPDATTTGSPLCSTVASTANVVSGRFRVALASSCKSVVNQNNGVYVEVIDGAVSLGRSPAGAVPYAIEADHAVSAISATNAAYAGDAGHASSAENATTATHSTNTSALASGGASGGLQVFEVPGSAIAAPCVVNAASTITSPIVDCTCPNGTYVVSGGGYAPLGTFLLENRPVNATTWRTTCASNSGQVPCGAYDLLCSRLGP